MARSSRKEWTRTTNCSSWTPWRRSTKTTSSTTRTSSSTIVKETTSYSRLIQPAWWTSPGWCIWIWTSTRRRPIWLTRSLIQESHHLRKDNHTTFSTLTHQNSVSIRRLRVSRRWKTSACRNTMSKFMLAQDPSSMMKMSTGWLILI